MYGIVTVLAKGWLVTSMGLLTGLYPERDLERYLIRQRCSPQPGGGRCAEKVRLSQRAYHLLLR